MTAGQAGTGPGWEPAEPGPGQHAPLHGRPRDELRSDPAWRGPSAPAPPAPRDPRVSGRSSVDVLAERLAAAIAPREPGYQLPRRSALARRYHASIPEIDAALEELAGRWLVRLLPSGEAYRAGPAEYLVSPEGLPSSSAVIDPMGNYVACRARRVSRLRATADTAGALGLTPGSYVHVCRTLWTAGGEPAASATTYVPDRLAYLLTGQRLEQAGPDAMLAAPAWTAQLGMLRAEMQPPDRAAARRLHLRTGLPAVTITARYHDRDRGDPVALTEVTLRPDRFRIVLDSTGVPGSREQPPWPHRFR